MTAIGGLFEHYPKNRLLVVTLYEAKVPVVLDHDLTGEAEADASAIGFGGVERDEDLLLFGQG